MHQSVGWSGVLQSLLCKPAGLGVLFACSVGKPSLCWEMRPQAYGLSRKASWLLGGGMNPTMLETCSTLSSFSLIRNRYSYLFPQVCIQHINRVQD